ncbi:MAG: ATP-binding protein [Candidatus Eremiobacteraeota bacterium]|nr:ATP-binding protein [Candidatus Eremiobacteraeota bacterium]
MCWSLDANDVRAARAARKAATAALGALTSSTETLGDAELVIGELLSNAARHADGNVCLELSLDDGHAQVSVHDTSATFALDMKRPPSDYSESGRGLFIISEIARKVSVLPVSGMGKRVVVTLDLPVPERAALAPRCPRSWLRHENGICLRPRVAKYLPETIRWPEL